MAQQMSEPRELFMHELGDMLYAEKVIEKALTTMAKEATNGELQAGFEEHREETRQQIVNLEQVFAAIGEKPQAENCPGIDGIKTEHDQFMKEKPSKMLADMFLTGAAARVEHYEIAGYTGLVTMAQAMGEKEAVRLLQENLQQEKHTLKKIEQISKRLAKDATSTAAAA